MSDRAMNYVGKGFAVLPVYGIKNGKCLCGNPNCPSPGKHPMTRNGLKDASRDHSQVDHWFTISPHANVAICTGDQYGIIVLDIDDKSGGHENLAKLEAGYGALPATVEEITGGGGRHIFFKSDGRSVKNQTGAGAIVSGVEVKGDGGYVVVAPSLHASGRNYEWVPGRAPGEIEIADAPEWLKSLIFPKKEKTSSKRIAVQGFESLETSYSTGGRNSALTSDAGKLRRAGFNEEEIFIALQGINAAKCDPPLEDEEVRRIANSVAKYATHFESTDVGNAERLVHRHGNGIRYCVDSKKWLVFDGKRWTRDRGHEVIEMAKAVAGYILDEAELAPDKAATELIKWAKKSQSQERISAMAKLAQSDSEVAVSENEFDCNTMLLNVQNGVIDLRSGTLLRHNPDLLFTQISPVNFDPTAKCPVWESAMEKWTNGDKELIAYLQRAFGYMLTGSTSEQCVFLIYGTGANGKSVVVNTVMRICGDYAIQTPVETIMVKQNGGIPNDIARLKGRRMAVASEGESGQKLAESLVKQMSGGDLLTGRFLFGEYFDFIPLFKLCLVTNHKPLIFGTDHGIWRRIHLIPFETTISEKDRDPKLQEKLNNEMPGILNWLIKGCLDWQKDGLKPPTVMQAAKTLYQHEMDAVGNFLEDECEMNSHFNDKGTELFTAYRDWAIQTGEKSSSQRVFYRRLREKGFENRKTGDHGPLIFHGLRRCGSNINLK